MNKHFYQSIMRLFCAFLMAFSFLTTVTFASDNFEDSMLDVITVAQKGDKKIEYSEELNGYILTNITVDEVLKSFDSSKTLKPMNNVVKKDLHNDLFERDAAKVLEKKSLQKAAASTYISEYTITNAVSGHRIGTYVNFYYKVRMEMKTVTINGKNYAQFVRVNHGSNTYLSSSGYTLDSGTTSPSYAVLNGGATLRVQNYIQLQTSLAYSGSISLSPGWFGISAGVGGTYYYRSNPQFVTTTYNLPIYDIVN